MPTVIEYGQNELELNVYPNNTPVVGVKYGAQFNVILDDANDVKSQFNASILGDPNMADYNGAKPVQTVRDDEFKIKLVSGESGSTATHALSVIGEGDTITAGVNDRGVFAMVKDSSGNADIAQKNVDGGVEVHVVNPIQITDGTDSLAINADGSINVGNTVAVSATDLDIRDLAFATDKVDASGSTITANQGTSPWVISGDVNISDNGGSITVDAVNLDIRDLNSATDSVTAVQGTSPWVISDLAHTKDSVKIGDGTDFLAINSDGSINVKMFPAAGTDVCNYQTSATVGVNSTVNHDYVVPNGQTFTGESVLVGARGAVKVTVGTWNGTTLTPKFVYFQDPKENRTQSISKLSLLGNGTDAIRISIQNIDGSSSDVYSTLQGDLN